MFAPRADPRRTVPYVSRHAIERRLEAEGLSPELIVEVMKDPRFMKRASEIIRQECAASVLLEPNQRRVFIHPGRERHQHERSRNAPPSRRRATGGGEYYAFSDRWVYVCESGCIITTILIDERQCKTLLDLGFAPNLAVEPLHRLAGRPDQ